LWARVARSGDGDLIPIIIELQQPLNSEGGIVGSPDWDAEQATLAAAMEHRFAARARDLVRGMRGLAHFPMVFGAAEGLSILEIATYPEVFRVYEDEIFHLSRVEGAALTKADVLRVSLAGGGAGVGVAVVDTGIDASHSEFTGRVVAGGDFTGTTGSGFVDDNGHGTKCAGIVAGAAGGMAPQASLWAIKVLKADGSATASSILDGLSSLFQNRNNFGGLDVISMSIQGGEPFNNDCDAVSPLNSVLNALSGAGIAIFVSSGNHGFLDGVTHPACHSKVLAVGAVYDADVGPRGPFPDADNCSDVTTSADQITCYSDSGTPLDILAPADCARTTAPGGGYDSCFNGTSAAAPYAAGVAAQLLSLRPATSPTSLKNAFGGTGKPITDVNGITRNRIDAMAAFQYLGGSGNTGPCVRDANTACLQSSHFEVRVGWVTASQAGSAQVMSFGGQRTENDESVFFTFFSPTNFEMGVKVLNACVPVLGNKYWVFVSGLTNQGWTVTVRDTVTGAVKVYSNDVGHLSTTFADTAAFGC